MKKIIISLFVLLNTTTGYALNDPMRPIETQKLQQKNTDLGPTNLNKKYWYILYSTIITDNRRLADINRKIVGVGDTVNEATVQKIEANRVVIKTKEKTIILSVSSNKGLKTAN